MKKIVLISGSPRLEEKTASSGFIERVAAALPGGYEKKFVNVRKSLKDGPETDYAAISEADAVVFVFPLYYFCLPGLLMRYLEDYEKYFRGQGGRKMSAKVYAIVNCGFPEPWINSEAAGVMRCFCRRVGADFRFAVLVGSGPMLDVAAGAPPVKKVFQKFDAAIVDMVADIGGEKPAAPCDVLIEMHFPRRLYFFMGNMNWRREIKKNGLKKDDLYRRPLQNT